MLFNTHEFIFLFLPITLVVYFALGYYKKYQVALGWLVVASLFFYGYWKPIYLLLLGSSIIVNYIFGRAISHHHGERHGYLLTILGVVFNLGLLMYFKYANLLVDSLNYVAATDFHLEKIILPLAISFFTFQQIAYLADAYKGETKEYNFLNYCLFVCFFPQLIAGPIVHHKEMLSQFARKETFHIEPENLAIGLTIFTMGLFKKVILADGVAVYATPVFAAADAGTQVNFYDAWAGIIAYSCQLYFDFSGYSDMAIGLARMFGIKLPLNFYSPFKSESIIEFWRRWHITLSRFLREYLYIALGGNRHGKFNRYRNLFLTMLLGGIWHGAGWNFALWGALQGFYLILNNGWRAIKPDWVLGHIWVNRALAVLLTSICTWISWAIFRPETMGGTAIMLEAMFGFYGLPDTHTLEHGMITGLEVLKWIIPLYLIAWFAPNTQEIMRKFEPVTNPEEFIDVEGHSRILWKPTKAWAIAIALMGAYAILSLNRVSEFLYFQF